MVCGEVFSTQAVEVTSGFNGSSIISSNKKAAAPHKAIHEMYQKLGKKAKSCCIHLFQRGTRRGLLFPYFVYLQINGMTDSWILKAITVYLDWGCQVKTVIWNLKVCLAWCTCLTKSKNPEWHKTKKRSERIHQKSHRPTTQKSFFLAYHPVPIVSTKNQWFQEIHMDWHWRTRAQ